MTDSRIPDPARNATDPPLDKATITAAVEEALARLKQARPHLQSRIDRAATYLVVQLSSSARTRPIRVRVRRTGRRVFLIASLSAGGAVYEVDPVSWSCSCPDHHRRGAACKHSIAAWVLASANRPLPKAPPMEIPCEVCGEAFPRGRLIEVQEGQAEETLNPGMKVCRMCARDHGLPSGATRQKGCDACEGGWVHLTEQIVDKETGELLEVTNTVRCRRCRERPPEPTLSDEEMARWMDESRWIFAKTYADTHPHEYCLRRHQDPERFDAAARTIWHLGWDRMYLGRPWRSLEIGDFFVWVYTSPKPGMPYPTKTILINRALRVHERRPGRQT